jgi:lipid-A-disaccharide synthase
MIKVAYATIVNIVAAREIFPEFLQSRCRAELIAPALEGLLQDPARASEIGRDAQAVATEIAGSGDRSSVRAARAIRAIVDTARTG